MHGPGVNESPCNAANFECLFYTRQDIKAISITAKKWPLNLGFSENLPGKPQHLLHPAFFTSQKSQAQQGTCRVNSTRSAPGRGRVGSEVREKIPGG